MMLHSLIMFAAALVTVSGLRGDFVGCFDHRKGLDSQFHKSGAPGSVSDCVQSCAAAYFRFANLYNGAECLCSPKPEDSAAGQCSSTCRSNSSQTCGGPNSRSVYETGQIVPGPPDDLQVLNVTESSVLVKWGAPRASNGDLGGYVVSAVAVQSYAPGLASTLRQWMYPATTRRAQLLPLHPGTLYNLSVAAVSQQGNGIQKTQLFSTQIGEPEEPEVPSVIRRDKGQIVIKIPEAKNGNGPISSYLVIVVDESTPSEFKEELLKSASLAQQQDLPYYITAELTPEEIKRPFVVGDGETYGGYYNAPLQHSGDIHVSIGLVSSKDGVRKTSFAHATHEQHGIVILDIHAPGQSGLELGLSVAIGVFGLLLLLSVVLLLLLRHRVHQRRRHVPYHQELTLQGPMDEIETSNGYIHNSFIPEDERVNHLEKLKQQVWVIPSEVLQVKSDLLGRGKFGEVRQGSVRGTPVAVHAIADTNLSPENRKNMLRDLDVLIRAGKHENIVALIGTHENADTLYVIVEYHPVSLKAVLLESRLLEHLQPEHQASRFCSLSEHHLLQVALGVARGMEYLASRKVVHKQLNTRNVLMCDGVSPKVGGFGISEYCRPLERSPDMTRWTAQEIFRSAHYGTKSDVWSFGCLLWEVAALGGTPYSNVAAKELPSRVMRGLVLPQAKHVSDDLYQLMLQCWQVDLDERPTFQQICQILEDLAQNSAMHMNFNVYAGFRYEQYLPEAE